ncbi:MAG: hypothetical protein AAF337_12930 [Pseudomonadota bacterium]
MLPPDLAFVEACDFSDVVLGSPAHQREVERCSAYTWAHKEQRKGEAARDITVALLKGECELAAELMDKGEGYYGGNVFEAMRLRQGICAETDPKKAVALLQERLAVWPDDPLALAQFGDMLWRGEGITQDRPRARQLFRDAVQFALPSYLRAISAEQQYDRYDPQHTWFIESVEGYYWGFTERQLRLNFADPVLGPWLLPPPLYEERLKVERTIERQADPILESVKSLMADDRKAMNELGAEILLEGAYADTPALQVALADFLMQTERRALPEAMGALKGSDLECEALSFLAQAAQSSDYPALSRLSPFVEKNLRGQLTPEVLEALFADPSTSQSELFDLSGDDDKGLILAAHSFVVQFMQNGFPVPEAFDALARRVLLDVRHADNDSLVISDYWDNTLVDSSCF